jgi:hypothetical protein
MLWHTLQFLVWQENNNILKIQKYIPLLIIDLNHAIDKVSENKKYSHQYSHSYKNCDYEEKNNKIIEYKNLFSFLLI